MKQLPQLKPLNIFRHTVETFITFLYPAQCRGCEKFIGLESIPYLCDACWHDIQLLQPPCCDICGVPLYSDKHPHSSSQANTCDECARKPPRYGKLRTIAFYQGTLRQAIHLFKFEKRTALAKPLIQLMTANLPTDCRIEDYDVIIPIPIHKNRLRERGFNQATLLAKGIANTTNVPVVTDTLIRDKDTQQQSNLSGRKARQENISEAFALRKVESVHGKQLLLVDDVFTTGATVQEAVKVLWRADPAEIDVLTLARTAAAKTS